MLMLSSLQHAEVLHSNLQRADGMFMRHHRAKTVFSQAKQLGWLVLELKHGVLIQFSMCTEEEAGLLCHVKRKQLERVNLQPVIRDGV